MLDRLLPTLEKLAPFAPLFFVAIGVAGLSVAAVFCRRADRQARRDADRGDNL